MSTDRGGRRSALVIQWPVRRSLMAQKNMPSVWMLSITRSPSRVGAQGAEAVTNQVTAGRLAGLEQGYVAAFETAGKIDDLAHLVARDSNAVHRKGITLDGELGGDLFVARRPIVDFGVTNVGQAYAEVDVEDMTLIEPQKVTFTYNASKGNWVDETTSVKQWRREEVLSAFRDDNQVCWRGVRQ